MDRPAVKYPLLFAALGMILKTVITLYGLEYQGLDMITRFLALPIFLMASAFLVIWYERTTDTSFLDHFKRGLKGGMIYGLIMALFSGLYYGSISPDYFEKVYDQRKAEVEKLLKKAKAADSKEDLKMEFPPDKNLEDLVRNLEERKKVLKDQLAYTRPFWVITLNLMIFTLVSIFSALSIALVGRYFFPKPSA